MLHGLSGGVAPQRRVVKHEPRDGHETSVERCSRRVGTSWCRRSGDAGVQRGDRREISGGREPRSPGTRRCVVGDRDADRKPRDTARGDVLDRLGTSVRADSAVAAARRSGRTDRRRTGCAVDSARSHPTPSGSDRLGATRPCQSHAHRVRTRADVRPRPPSRPPTLPSVQCLESARGRAVRRRRRSARRPRPGHTARDNARSHRCSNHRGGGHCHRGVPSRAYRSEGDRRCSSARNGRIRSQGAGRFVVGYRDIPTRSAASRARAFTHRAWLLRRRARLHQPDSLCRAEHRIGDLPAGGRRHFGECGDADPPQAFRAWACRLRGRDGFPSCGRP